MWQVSEFIIFFFFFNYNMSIHQRSQGIPFNVHFNLKVSPSRFLSTTRRAETVSRRPKNIWGLCNDCPEFSPPLVPRLRTDRTGQRRRAAVQVEEELRKSCGAAGGVGLPTGRGRCHRCAIVLLALFHHQLLGIIKNKKTRRHIVGQNLTT